MFLRYISALACATAVGSGGGGGDGIEGDPPILVQCLSHKCIVIVLLLVA